MVECIIWYAHIYFLNYSIAALSPEDVCKVRVGKLSLFTIGYLRDIKTFLGVSFNVQPDRESKTVMLTCLGSGFINVNKKTA
jgi:RNA 3'-terminal phosphate cyclase-like protein